MLPDREGRFKATILEHGVAETGPNNLATFVCQFGLIQELVNGEWIATDQDLAISGYFYLEKKDGSINTVTLDQLKSAFGWDGRDPLWLQDADFSQLVVQVKLEFEQYDGKQRLKVRYVDAEDAMPAGVPRADDNARRTLSARLGSRLRALAGGTPAPAPKPAGKPTATPAPPTASKPAPKVPTAAPARTATMQQAWQAFAKECPRGWEQKDIEQEWFRVLGELFPNTQLDAFTPQQWAIALEQAPSRIVPI
ncbi:hypothetical protein [Fontivita pretiosa]|uniref:hypothetical protein n=1 Tax=Fontivita pretiosa TaxID=2989684 RepID=UPI003D16C3D0